MDGRIAVVTGAAQGIGRDISIRFAKEGAKVALLDYDLDAAKATAASIGNASFAFHVDVSDDASVADSINEVRNSLGAIDVLVNNAAAAIPRSTVDQLDISDLRKAIDVNLIGVFLMCRAVLPDMIARRSGRIINIASQLGSVATANNAAYCATKGAVLQLTRALALDHAADGILVNSLSPGAVLTPRILDAYGTEEAADAALAGKHPLGRIGRPEEIAGAAVFLASEDARFMTGADLVVDGGYLAQ